MIVLSETVIWINVESVSAQEKTIRMRKLESDNFELRVSSKF